MDEKSDKKMKGNRKMEDERVVLNGTIKHTNKQTSTNDSHAHQRKSKQNDLVDKI